MEAAREARRRLELEQEKLTQRAEQLKGFMSALEATEDLLEEIERLQGELQEERSQWQEEKEQLRSQLQEEKDKNTKLEMQLKEMSKMTACLIGVRTFCDSQNLS